MIAKLWSYNFRFSTIFSQLLLRNKIMYQLNSQISLDENYSPCGHLQDCCRKESLQFEFKFHLLSVKEVRITYFMPAFIWFVITWFTLKRRWKYSRLNTFLKRFLHLIRSRFTEKITFQYIDNHAG